MTDAFLAAFDALPAGSFTGVARGRRYVVSKTSQVAGASQKLVAEQLDGPDYISCNVYRLTQGARLKPCEMSSAKVVAFVLALRPEAPLA